MLHQFSVCSLTLEWRITQIPVQRMIADERINERADVMLITGIGVIGSLSHQALAYRTGLNVATAQQEILSRLNDQRLESALPERAGSRITPVEIRDIVPSQPLHHLPQTLIIFRRQQQMKMRRQKNISMNCHIKLFGRVQQHFAKHGNVSCIMKNEAIVIAALHYMMLVMRDGESGQTGHEIIRL